MSPKLQTFYVSYSIQSIKDDHHFYLGWQDILKCFQGNLKVGYHVCWFNSARDILLFVLNCMKPELYFDKQKRFESDCAKCALNNFLGMKTFSKKDLDTICKQLSQSFINPHKSLFGGDYDINVLIKALEKHSYELRWLKKSQTLQEVIKGELWKGFLVNIQRKKKFWHVILDQSARHWCCLKKIQKNDNEYGYFDSLKEQRQNLDLEGALKFLQDLRKQNQTLLVIERKNYSSEVVEVDSPDRRN